VQVEVEVWYWPDKIGEWLGFVKDEISKSLIGDRGLTNFVEGLWATRKSPLMVPCKLDCIVNFSIAENPHFRQLLGNILHVEFYRIHETAYVVHGKVTLLPSCTAGPFMPSAVSAETPEYGLGNQRIIVALPVQANDLPEPQEGDGSPPAFSSYGIGSSF
jgi:hypothetical protein